MENELTVPTLKVLLMEEQRNHLYNITEKIEEHSQKQFILCDIPGAGKTMTCLAIAKRATHGDSNSKVLVVGPPPAINSWVSDARIHFEPSFRNVVLASSSEKNRCFFSTINDCQLIILSYDALCAAHKSAVQWRSTVLKTEIRELEARYPRGENTRTLTTNDLKEYEEGRQLILQIHSFLMEHKRTEDMSVDIPFPKLSARETDRTLRPMLFDNLYNIRFKWLFADEAHEARNNKSVKFASLRDIRRDYSMAVSATICNNSAEDYVSALKIIGVRPQQSWLSLRRNKDACAAFMNECSKQLIVVSPKEIRDKVRGSYCPKSVLLRPREFFHPEEYEAYEKERLDWKENVGKKTKKDTVLRVITALRQKCDFAETKDESKGVLVRLKNGECKRVVSTKLEMVVAYIKSQVVARNEKVLVFCWFKNTIEVLKAMLPKNLKVDVIVGSVSQDNRQKILSSFSRARTSAVLIATTRTLSLGVNIQSANHCILVNNWWNPVVSEQALCRIARPGQKRSIRWVQAMIPNTVEDSIKLMAEFKVDLNDHMIAGTITPPMLESITSNKAIQRAAGSSKSKKANPNNLPINLLLPIVNQDTEAIINMRALCHPVSMESATSSSSSSSTCFLSPHIDRAEYMIQETYDFVIRNTEDLAVLPDTHSIDLAHVPKAREEAAVKTGMEKFVIKRAADEAAKKAFLKRKREQLPPDERGFIRLLSEKERAKRRETIQGKQRRTTKLISFGDIESKTVNLPEQNKRQCRRHIQPPKTVSSSITSSIERLQNISSFFTHTTTNVDQ